MTHVLMLAAENGALPGGKVGGIGDVVRDVPIALANRGWLVTVVTPAYGSFNSLPGSKKITRLNVPFADKREAFGIYEVPVETASGMVRHVVIDHPLFASCGEGKIYCDDISDRPFATDATKFALFCACAAQAIVKGTFGKLDVLHLHDWHAALLLVLRKYNPGFRALQKLHCAYSIHNLAIQGIRPFAKDESSLESWFPDLTYDCKTLADPRWTDCINPMAVAIRLADKVHAVSPSYAKEILLPSDNSGRGTFGGEGLEQDLARAKNEGRLFGILNGCEYQPEKKPVIKNWQALLQAMPEQLLQMASTSAIMNSAHFVTQQRLQQIKKSRPGILITSVGRITDQKIGLLKQHTSQGRPALDILLETLGDSGLVIMVGSGNKDDELFLTRTAAKYANLLYFCGYSDPLGEALYQVGDLFLMPSSFEPCGISQMLALRAGQPCLVHQVGGLRDTVKNNKTGFCFSGHNPADQADKLVATFKKALKLHNTSPEKWKVMRKTAASERFEWADTIDAYIKQLYQ